MGSKSEPSQRLLPQAHPASSRRLPAPLSPNASPVAEAAKVTGSP